MIDRNVFRRTLAELLQCRQKGQEWLDEVPASIKEAFYDNEYVTSTDDMFTAVLEAWLGNQVLIDDVSWFLYDWRPGFDILVQRDDKEISYTINDIDDYVQYLVDNKMISAS